MYLTNLIGRSYIGDIAFIVWGVCFFILSMSRGNKLFRMITGEKIKEDLIAPINPAGIFAALLVIDIITLPILWLIYLYQKFSSM